MRYGLPAVHSAFLRSHEVLVGAPDQVRRSWHRCRRFLALVSEGIKIEVLIVDFFVLSVEPDRLDRIVEL